MSIKLLVLLLAVSAGAFFIVRKNIFHNDQEAIVQSEFKKVTVIPKTNADSLSPCLQKLFKAYPGKFIAATKNSVIWFDSSEMVFDDKKHPKSFQAMLDSADMEDQVCAMKYPRDSFSSPDRKSVV